MVRITLPDGSVRDYDGATTAATVAADIGPGLAKAALAARLDGDLVDLRFPVEALSFVDCGRLYGDWSPCGHPCWEMCWHTLGTCLDRFGMASGKHSDEVEIVKF